MVDKAIIDYLNNGVKQGYSIAALKQSLLDQGWGEPDVQQAVALMQSQIDQASKKQQTEKASGSKGKRIVAIVVVVAVAAVSIFIYFYGQAFFEIGLLNTSAYQPKRCNGFQYFTYVDQVATNTEFTIDIINGIKDVQIRNLQVGGVITSSPEVKAPYYEGWIPAEQAITLRMGELLLPEGSYDSLEVIITYDVKGGIGGNTDSAICVGYTI